MGCPQETERQHGLKSGDSCIDAHQVMIAQVVLEVDHEVGSDIILLRKDTH
jgi:hypothetical protein